jgi:hypothetical protein
MVACDFFTVDTVTLRGNYVLVLVAELDALALVLSETERNF